MIDRLCLQVVAVLLLVVFVRTHPCIPGKGKTGLVIGQDYYSITNYTQVFHQKGGTPACAFMSYTALDPPTGLRVAINYGSVTLTPTLSLTPTPTMI